MKNFQRLCFAVSFLGLLGLVSSCTPDKAPVVAFSATPRSGDAPLTVRFTDQTDLGGDIVVAEYLWSFGDGQSSVEASPIHIYTAQGTYTVSLQVTTTAGETTKEEIAFIQVTDPITGEGEGESEGEGSIEGEGGAEGEGEGESPLPDLGVNASLNGWRPFGDGDEWNRPVDGDPVAANSDVLIDYYGRTRTLRIDAGNTEEYYGIPYIVVPGTQANVTIEYGVGCPGDPPNDYSNESDLGPFPVPLNAPIEGGSTLDPDPTCGDRHVLVIDRDNMMLYELYNTIRIPGGFRCSSSAVWELNATNNVRPEGWTSADAAGMPIFPGLLKYDEAASGEIRHALRLTVPQVRRAYTYPGNHFGPYSIDNRLTYGQRLRLKSTFNEAPYSGATLAVIRALKKYGLIVADQGSAWYITSVTNPGWEDVRPVIQSITADNLEVLEPQNPVVVGY